MLSKASREFGARFSFIRTFNDLNRVDFTLILYTVCDIIKNNKKCRKGGNRSFLAETERMVRDDLTTLRNLNEMVRYGAENFGERNFLEYKNPDGTIASKTYAQFKAACDSACISLTERGFGGAHVALVGPTSFEWITGYFSAAMTGGAAVPLAPSETDEMNCRLMAFADVSVFAFDKKHESLYKLAKETVGSIKLFVSLDNTASDPDVINFNELLSLSGEYDGDPDPDTMCAIVFTSGTTGFPKGVMSSHKNMIYSATSVHVACPTTRMFCCLPIHHSFCFTANITKSIVRGKTVCVNDSLANLVSDLHLFKPDSIVAVPQIVKKLMGGAIKFAASKPELPEEKAVNMFLGGNIIDVISGGAPLEAAANARFNATGILVLNGYGMTECSPVIANNAVGCFRHGSVGKPIPCMQVKIENGEILVKGPSVMLGYYKNPEATKEAFTEDGFLHTGDLGHFDDDGFLYVTGRCKNLILLENGENVSAEMLEEQFANEPLVQEVICYGENGAICAEVYLNKGYVGEHGITDEKEAMTAVLMRINENLASYQRISTFKIRPIPFERTSSSKIKRSSKMDAVKKEIVEPATDTEKRVCRAVKELLQLPEVSVTDNFFAIGGDSLNAMELAVSLNISAQLIYDKPFLNKLAEEIDAAEKKKSDKIDNINEIIKATAHKGEKHNGYKCALLTGATGFLGVHILKKLIDNGIETYCLVRSREKLDSQLKFYFTDFESPLIHAVTGDIEKEKLGLSDEKYTELADKIDVVFHVAANVHHAGDYADLERTNVTGTMNVIDFAKAANAVLQHTSTVSVHGAATVKQTKCKSVFDESVLDIGQRYQDNVYIHSKYCAEQLVLSARQDGLEVNIYRIGNLTWRVSDGKFQKNSDDNGFLRRVHAMLKLGLLNENMDKYPTDLTAVDECADAYVRLALTGNVNEIYHMINPNFLLTEDMFRSLNVPFRRVSTQETVETVFANTDDRDIHVYMFYLIISGRSANIEMDNSYTVSCLDAVGFAWSKPDKAYLTVSDSVDRPNGHCLDFTPCELKPMRTKGGVLNPIQKLTLGVMHDAKFVDSVLLHGENALEKLSEEIKKANVKNPLFLLYPGAEKNNKIEAFITSVSSSPILFSGILAEPTTEITDEVLKVYFENGCDAMVAVGGGSVLDTAKITALRAANPEEEIDDICKIDSIASPCVPLFAVPTTSGTGSEVTAFAVITDTEENKKKPFVSDRFQPLAVALDPSLTVSVPPMSTAFTGIDALSHAVEAAVNSFAPSFPEDRAYCGKAAGRILHNLKIAHDCPTDLTARDEMQLASFEAGLAFRRIGTGYIHAIAHRLGEFYHLPHGQAIAAVFVPVLKASLDCCEKALSELAKECAVSNADSDQENAGAFLEAVETLIASFGINATDIAFNESDLDEIVRRAQEEAKLMGAPKPFSDDELRKLIREIFA